MQMLLVLQLADILSTRMEIIGDSNLLVPLYLRKSQAELLFNKQKECDLMGTNLIVQKFTEADLMQISDIIEKDFDDFWNYNILKTELKNNNSIYLCCIYEGEIVGFGGITIILDTAELNNIVIKKDKRGLGFSKILLQNLIDKAKQNNCKKMNLEVSIQNTIAINLYKSFGFNQVGKRQKYYNGIDALLFTLDL